MAMSAAKVLARKFGLNVADVTLATAMTGKQAAQFLGVGKKVGDEIAGSDALDVQVVFDALTSGYADKFVITWERADKPIPNGRTARSMLKAGGTTTTVTPIPTGTSCRIVSVEPEEDAPTDWHWGPTVFTPSDGEVQIVEGTNAKIVVTPSIVMDTGSLEISSVLVNESEPPAVWTDPFEVTYMVDSGDPVTVEVPVNGSVVIEDLPGGAVVQVAGINPDDPEGYEWETLAMDPVDGTVDGVTPNSADTVELTYTIVTAE